MYVLYRDEDCEDNNAKKNKGIEEDDIIDEVKLRRSTRRKDSDVNSTLTFDVDGRTKQMTMAETFLVYTVSHIIDVLCISSNNETENKMNNKSEDLMIDDKHENKLIENEKILSNLTRARKERERVPKEELERDKEESSDNESHPKKRKSHRKNKKDDRDDYSSDSSGEGAKMLKKKKKKKKMMMKLKKKRAKREASSSEASSEASIDDKKKKSKEHKKKKYESSSESSISIEKKKSQIRKNQKNVTTLN